MNKNIYFFLLTLLFLLDFSFVVHGMAPDGIHTFDDYVNLSYEDQAFDAACAVKLNSGGGHMTGVLVSRRVVMTAAHGIEAVLDKKAIKAIQNSERLKIIPLSNVSVIFMTRDKDGIVHEQRIPVIAALLDVRYFDGAYMSSRMGRFDFAYLILDGTPEGIMPAQLATSLPYDAHFIKTVVTYGTSDQSFIIQKTTRRAFRLYECDTFFSGGKDPEVLKPSRHLQESSLFFKPLFLDQKPDPTSDEETLRSFEATQNWLKDYKKPYGLALPGTSGSPVFIHVVNPKGQVNSYLMGLVSSYSHLSGVFDHSENNLEVSQILMNPLASLNKYQTIYSLPYKIVDSQNAYIQEKRYDFDPVVKDYLLLAQMFAAQYPDHPYKKEEKRSIMDSIVAWFKTLL